MSLRVAIAGASGYAGGEFARLVGQHPEWELGALTAHRNEGRLVRDLHPHLRSAGDAMFLPTTTELLANHDIVVLALPHGESGALGEQLSQENPGLVIVDLGADRRLKSADQWEKFYRGDHHQPWVYGIPELVRADGSKQREALRGATRIAAPGCNASAVILALAPLVQAGLVDTTDIVATLSVGPSGAGRTLREDLLASERLGSAAAYSVGGTHRHIPEIRQALADAGAQADIAVSLTPVLVPMSRGILAVVTARLSATASPTDVSRALRAAYDGEPFVDLSPEGVFPATGNVLGSNTVAISSSYDPVTNRLTIISAIDNLVKGTAGAAVQSLNIALGYPETSGLTVDGVAP